MPRPSWLAGWNLTPCSPGEGGEQIAVSQSGPAEGNEAENDLTRSLEEAVLGESSVSVWFNWAVKAAVCLKVWRGNCYFLPRFSISNKSSLIFVQNDVDPIREYAVTESPQSFINVYDVKKEKEKKNSDFMENNFTVVFLIVHKT